MSDKHKKYYHRLEFYLITLTVLLWIAFLFKVFKQNIPPDLPNNKNMKLSTKAPGSFKLKRQHNAASQQPEKKQPDQMAIEALRESLEKVKHAENIIIRGEVLTPIQATGRNKQVNIERFINQKNLKSLNADYINALKK